MKKLSWFLIIVLLLGCFAGCQQAPEEGAERSVENADGTLSDWMKEKIAEDYAQYCKELHGPDVVTDAFTKWHDAGYANGTRYYGIHQEYFVFLLPVGINFGAADQSYCVTIGEWRFIRHSSQWFTLLAYKNGNFYMVEDLYREGIFEEDVMNAILNKHNEVEEA